MDEWSGLRTALAVLGWVTMGLGLLMALIWYSRGGSKAVGPEDAMMAESGVGVERRGRRLTSFSSSQVGIHGLLGLMTAFVVSRAALLDGDRSGGYGAALVAVLVTAIPGSWMFWKWRTGQMPAVPGVEPSPKEERVEDHLPRVVVYLHGLGAVAILAIAVLLFVAD